MRRLLWRRGDCYGDCSGDVETVAETVMETWRLLPRLLWRRGDCSGDCYGDVETVVKTVAETVVETNCCCGDCCWGEEWRLQQKPHRRLQWRLQRILYCGDWSFFPTKKARRLITLWTVPADRTKPDRRSLTQRLCCTVLLFWCQTLWSSEQ